MKLKPAIVFVFIAIATATAWSADSWQGKVVGISDGDTITVMHDGKAEKIRLYGIDTPEMGQPFGKNAKVYTSDQVFGKMVNVVPIDRDRYGRTVALIYLHKSSESLNEGTVKSGYAWVYRKYCKAGYCSHWLQLEQDAKNQQLGLWIEKNPSPPWDFRKTKRSKQK